MADGVPYKQAVVTYAPRRQQAGLAWSNHKHPFLPVPVEGGQGGQSHSTLKVPVVVQPQKFKSTT